VYSWTRKRSQTSFHRLSALDDSHGSPGEMNTHCCITNAKKRQIETDTNEVPAKKRKVREKPLYKKEEPLPRKTYYFKGCPAKPKDDPPRVLLISLEKPDGTIGEYMSEPFAITVNRRLKKNDVKQLQLKSMPKDILQLYSESFSHVTF